jgi:hypothetical protein
MNRSLVIVKLLSLYNGWASIDNSSSGMISHLLKFDVRLEIPTYLF